MTPSSIGELLLHEISSVCVIEDEDHPQGWAGEQARRVAWRLNQRRTPRSPLEPVVFWSPRVNAFTAPGPYVFITRELQQRLPHDAAVAFVLAHEMAHHDLRHFGALDDRPMTDVQELVTASWFGLVKLARSPENELDADRYALQLCMQAGYQGAECLEAFRVLIAHALDWGDLDGVFGQADEPPATDEPSRWLRFRRWWWQRGRGYRSLVERRERLEQALACADAQQGSPSQTSASPFRTACAADPVIRCASCGREAVSRPGDRCTTCLRSAGFERRLARAVRQERRKAFVENWGRGLLVLALVLAVLVASYLYRSYRPSSSAAPPAAPTIGAHSAPGPNTQPLRRNPLQSRHQRHP